MRRRRSLTLDSVAGDDDRAYINSPVLACDTNGSYGSMAAVINGTARSLILEARVSLGDEYVY